MAIFAVLVALRLVLPLGLEWVIPWASESQMGGRVEVDNVDLGLFAGTLVLEEIRVRLPEDLKLEAATGSAHSAAGRGNTLLALERLEIDLDWLPLLSGRVHLRLVEIVGPSVGLVQNRDGSLRLPSRPDSTIGPPAESKPATQADEKIVTDLPAPLSTEAEPEQGAGGGWEIVLDHLELTRLGATLDTAAGLEVVRVGAERFALDALVITPDGIALGDLALEDPQVYVQRDWFLNSAGGLAEASPPDDADPTDDDKPSKIPTFMLKHLAIDRADFTVRTARGPLAVSVELEVAEAGAARNHVFPINLQLGLGEGDVIVQGELGLNPFSYEGRFAWQSLPMAPFLLLAAPDLVPWLQSFKSGGDFQLSLHTDPDHAKAGVSLSGASHVSELSFREPESGELAIGWENFEAQIRNAFLPLEPTAASPGQLEFDRIILSKPTFVFTNPPGALEKLMALLGGDVASDSEGPDPEEIEVAGRSEDAEAPSAPPPVVRVSQLEIRDGTLTFLDSSVSPVHQSVIENFHLQAEDFVSAPALGLGSIQADGLIQKTGTFELTGGVPAGSGSLQFDLQQLELVPYAGFAQSAGWSVERGATTLHSLIRVGEDSCEADNELVLHDLAVASVDDATLDLGVGVSLDLALALLRDHNGDIQLSIPVTWKKGELGVSAGALVASALKSALVGALSSPFKMIGALIPDGGGAPSFEPILLAAGASELSPEAAEQLAPLAELLTKRPTLGVALRGQTGPEDLPFLAETMLREKALSGSDFPEVENVEYFAQRRVAGALVARSAGQPGLLESEDQALLERFIDGQSVPEARYLELARQRAEVVRDGLVAAGAPIESIELEQPTLAEAASVAVKLRAH